MVATVKDIKVDIDDKIGIIFNYIRLTLRFGSHGIILQIYFLIPLMFTDRYPIRNCLENKNEVIVSL